MVSEKIEGVKVEKWSGPPVTHLNGVLVIFEKLAFDQHLRKVKESKGRAFQVKGTATAWGLPLKR